MQKIFIVLYIFLAASVKVYSQDYDWITIANGISTTNNVSVTSENQLLVSRFVEESSSVALIDKNGDLIWEKNICDCSNAQILISAETTSGDLIHLSNRGRLFKTNNLGEELEELDNVLSQYENAYTRDAEISNGQLYFAGRGLLDGEYNIYRGSIDLSDLELRLSSVKSNWNYKAFTKIETDDLWYEVLTDSNQYFVSVYQGDSVRLIDTFSINTSLPHSINDLVV